MNCPISRIGAPPRGWMLTAIGRRRPGSWATVTAQAWVRLLYTRTSPVSNGSVLASRPPQPAPSGRTPDVVRTVCAAGTARSP
ncbi:hypothetical protein ACFTWH_07360 [Streptomyces sp. NPDC057011]|uniref:hypothetical protein n=1 Tax=Streptomyces sp. NPDC057011 TaxID=3345998 RepID=UPI003639EE2F